MSQKQDNSAGKQAGRERQDQGGKQARAPRGDDRETGSGSGKEQ